MALYANGKKICSTNIVYEAPIEIPREVVNGVYKYTADTSYTLPSEVTELGDYALSNAFIGDNMGTEFLKITSVDLSSVITISGSRAMYCTFQNNDKISSVNLSSLRTVSGDYALASAFEVTWSLPSISFPALEVISGDYAFTYAFGDTIITSLTFPSLHTLTGSNVFNTAFPASCIESLSFPALTSTSFGSKTNQFHDMFEYGGSGVTVHFPSSLQSVIGSWSDVQSGFSGGATVTFDLPATS